MISSNLTNSLKSEILNSKKATIIPHRNPDGDAMGSTLALYHFLKEINVSATVISPNNFPEFLAWLPGSENVIFFENDTIKATELLQNSDLIFTLDFNAFHRTGDLMAAELQKLKTTFVMIDHHELPDNYAKYTFSDTSIGSTCQMIYQFIADLDCLQFLNSTIATCIYTGIVTDSGSFRYPSTNAKTHQVVANLLEIGVKNAEIHQNLFDTSSYNRLKLLGRALQNMKILPEYKTAYISLSQDDLNEFNFKKGDTESFVNYGLSIKGIDFAAIFIENLEEKIIKISFRSQGSFDVNEFSRNYFSGGGHKNASGGKSVVSLHETTKRFEEIVKSIKNKL